VRGAAGSLVAQPRTVTTPAPVAQRRRERAENFPVALRLLPAELRADLHAIYGVARAIDDLGDEAAGDRLALLDGFDADLQRVWRAEPDPEHPTLRPLVGTVRRHDLPIGPFQALIEANRVDQVRSSYPTWAELRGYCALSADPVGRLVLLVLDAATPERVALSDDVCTALQLLEHCQDVGEDRRRGRTYLPLADLRAHGVSRTDLDLPVTSYAVRRLLAAEVARAEALLASGPPLVRSLTGAGRWAVAGFVAGGFATVEALRHCDFDVLAAAPRPSRAATVRHAARLVGSRA
jgi:squalene synthase HpnC